MHLDNPSPLVTQASFYRPGLDVLRITAFALVFFAHAFGAHLQEDSQLGAFSRSGEYGVCVFFFLSAYLITELLLREKLRSQTIHIQAFYARRVLRIWPLYFGAIIVGGLRGLFSPRYFLSGYWLSAFLLMYTNVYTKSHGYPPGFLFPLWSISVEEQFYLFWPLVVRSLSRRQLAVFATAIFILSYIRLDYLLLQHASMDPRIWADSLVQFQFFALGAITALAVRGRTPKIGRVGRILLFLIGLLCFRCGQLALFDDERYSVHDFSHIAPCFAYAVCGCLCIFLSLLSLSADQAWKPLIYLGRISYGLYVFHVFFLGGSQTLFEKLKGGPVELLREELIVIFVAFIGTVGTAGLSYRYFETPFLKLKKRFATPNASGSALAPSSSMRPP